MAEKEIQAAYAIQGDALLAVSNLLALGSRVVFTRLPSVDQVLAAQGGGLRGSHAGDFWLLTAQYEDLEIHRPAAGLSSAIIESSIPVGTNASLTQSTSSLVVRELGSPFAQAVVDPAAPPLQAQQGANQPANQGQAQQPKKAG